MTDDRPDHASSDRVDEAAIEAADDLVQWATRVLARDIERAVAVPGYDVVRLEGAAGQAWYVKAAATDNEFAAEVDAYRHWAPHLADRVPTLVDAEPARRWLLLTDVGVPVPSDRWHTPAVHRGAGAFLRRLHAVDAGPLRSVARTHRRGIEALDDLADLLTIDQRQFVRECVERLDRMPPLEWVPCHGDFAPWNLHDVGGGRLGVVDFGHAGLARRCRT